MGQGRRPRVTVAGEEKYLAPDDYVLGAGDVYGGTTQYQQGQIRRFWGSAMTGSDGRITFYPTTTGTVTGAALFSSIGGYSVTARTNSTDPTAIPSFFVESISSDLKTVVVRGVKGRTIPILILGSYPSTEFVGAGLMAAVQLVGTPL